MKDKPYVLQIEININLEETINIGSFSNIQPVYGEKLIINPSLIPKGMTLEEIRAAHILHVQKTFNDVRHAKFHDFLNYYNQGIVPYKLPG